MTRYIAYSVASFNALASSNDRITEALNRAVKANFLPGEDMLIVFETASQGPLHHMDGNIPRDAKIVWRGEDELAQRFRR